ncbi:unnamed protein product [Lathyrus sativus]|nr:unnamed protein product [Lathyrus sativus]
MTKLSKLLTATEIHKTNSPIKHSWKKSSCSIFVGVLVVPILALTAATIPKVQKDEGPPFEYQLTIHVPSDVNSSEYYTNLSNFAEAKRKLKNQGKKFIVEDILIAIENRGNDLSAIDLTKVSQELNCLADDVDLVILEGMGHDIETNLHAQF